VQGIHFFEAFEFQNCVKKFILGPHTSSVQRCAEICRGGVVFHHINATCPPAGRKTSSPRE